MDYTITTKDIKDYLATLQDDEEAGKTGDIQHCLIARALAHKYDQLFYVGTTGFWLASTPMSTMKMSREVSNIRMAFDNSLDEQRVFSRTRVEVETGIPELRP